MCEEKNKSEQNQSNPESKVIIKGQLNDKLYDRIAKEGYQPTDKLDTTKPPVDQGNDKTK